MELELRSVEVQGAHEIGGRTLGGCPLSRGPPRPPPTSTPTPYIHVRGEKKSERKFYCIMGCYYTLCHNTYAYSLLFYKVYIRRENAGSWNSGLEKEQKL